MPTLILTPRHTADSQSLWRAASRLGWSVHRLSSWRVADELRSLPDPVLYVEALFGPLLAESFGLRFDEPPADWLCRLPPEYVRRHVRLTTLGQARREQRPYFVKPPNDKCFPARVYTGSELPVDFDDSVEVLVAEIVRWESEFRCFVLDRVPRTISIYARYGDLQRDADFAHAPAEMQAAQRFLAQVLADARIELPRAAVIDVGVIEGRGWAVVEQNAAWGAGIYGCDPEEVLGVLRHAAAPAR
jgi:hypothetical protein